MENGMAKVVIGIPFWVNEYTESIELCLSSIKKYAKIDVEICILLHTENADVSNANILRLLKRYNTIKFKLYEEKRNGLYKQFLIDWIRTEYSNFDYMIIMHSDVFLWNEYAIENLLKPYLNDSNYVATFKTLPFYDYKSTFHLNEQKTLFLAPRISSWFFSLNIKRYNELVEKANSEFDKGLFEGHLRYSKLPNDYKSWITEQYNLLKNKNSKIEDIFVDIGSFFYYYLLINPEYKYYSFGEDTNPSFKSMELIYREDGIVHIEQFDNTRFNNKLYAKDLLKERAYFLKEILENEYGD